MNETLSIQATTCVLTRERLCAYWELTKPGIGGMVLLVTALGFYLAWPRDAGPLSLLLLFDTVLGTALVASGANAVNQYLEAAHDGRMARTAERPLPSGRLTADEVLAFAVLLSGVGVAYLALFVNPVAAALAATAHVTYVFLYTPLKRVTPLCVFVGAFSGALPPAIGWAGAAGSISLGAVLLFGILFFWQLPHFASIAWLYREDYARAGYPMLPVVDPEGTRTCLHLLTHTVALLFVSVLPVAFGLSGGFYAFGAMGLGLAFFALGGWFVVRRTTEAARTHLLASLVYLPCVFALMVIDRAVLP